MNKIQSLIINAALDSSEDLLLNCTNEELDSLVQEYSNASLKKLRKLLSDIQLEIVSDDMAMWQFANLRICKIDSVIRERVRNGHVSISSIMSMNY